MKSKYSFWQVLAIIVGIFAISFGAHAGYLDTSGMLAIGVIGNMTNAQARVIDPILTTVAQGYKNGQMVADYLFPVVPVDQRGGKILQFGKEDFELYNTARAPGTNTKRVQFGHLGLPYALEQHALEGKVAFEHLQEANQVPGINLGRGAVTKTQNIILLSNEYQAASIARNVANYAAANKATLAGTSRWDDYASGVSDPAADVDAAVEAIRAQVGMRPNTVVLSPKAYKAAKRHPKLIDRIKYTSRDSLTLELLADLFDVERVVSGDAIYNANGTMTDVWGKDVVVAYTEIATADDGGAPSYGYTYRLRGNPTVEMAYQDRNAKSWIYPVTDERAPVIAAAAAGYLLQTVVS
ncbi:MAG: major capsid protein [Gallionellaceae bacterium]|nr:major capsid protein [Gallionellaceae bacterium]